MWRYDVHHNSWLRMASMNEPRSSFSLVMLDGCVFAVGGQGIQSQHSIEQYDQHTDTWQLMESVGVAADCHPASCNVVALDGHLYFIGGVPRDGGGPVGPVAKYKPKTSVWTQLAPIQIPRTSSAACVLNGKIYVIGGKSYINNIQTCEKTMECFNPQTNQWTMCASMQVKRISHGVAVVDGKIYVLGGRDFSGPVCNIECYCEETDAWEAVEQMALVGSNSDLKCVSLKLRNDHIQPLDDDEDDDSIHDDNSSDSD